MKDWIARVLSLRSSQAPDQDLSIGVRIDRIRERLGISMTQLAAVLHLQRTTLYKWYQGRQPHAGTEARIAAVEAFAGAWAAQALLPLGKFWDVKIPATNLRVCDVLCDPLRDQTALLALLPNIRAVTRPDPVIDPYAPRKRRSQDKQPSAFAQTAPPLWHPDE